MYSRHNMHQIRRQVARWSWWNDLYLETNEKYTTIGYGSRSPATSDEQFCFVFLISLDQPKQQKPVLVAQCSVWCSVYEFSVNFLWKQNCELFFFVLFSPIFFLATFFEIVRAVSQSQKSKVFFRPPNRLSGLPKQKAIWHQTLAVIVCLILLCSNKCNTKPVNMMDRMMERATAIRGMYRSHGRMLFYHPNVILSRSLLLFRAHCSTWIFH